MTTTLWHYHSVVLMGTSTPGEHQLAAEHSSLTNMGPPAGYWTKGNCWSRQTSPTRAASPRPSPGPPSLPPCTSFYGVGVRERERESERERYRDEVTSALPSTRPYTRLYWGYVIRGGGAYESNHHAGPHLLEGTSVLGVHNTGYHAHKKTPSP